MSETPSAEALGQFEKWWATKVAEGYQYGDGPLATVRFGFTAGFAAAIDARPQGVCVWTLNDSVNQMYQASCRPMFLRHLPSHTYSFCPYCGKKLVEKENSDAQGIA